MQRGLVSGEPHLVRKRNLVKIHSRGLVKKVLSLWVGPAPVTRVLGGNNWAEEMVRSTEKATRNRSFI